MRVAEVDYEGGVEGGGDPGEGADGTPPGLRLTYQQPAANTPGQPGAGGNSPKFKETAPLWNYGDSIFNS